MRPCTTGQPDSTRPCARAPGAPVCRPDRQRGRGHGRDTSPARGRPGPAPGRADPRAGGLRSGPARVARRPAAQGCRWIAPDLRGYRGSPARAPFGYGIHAADIARAIADPDPAQVTLMGRSFCGVLTTPVPGGLFRALPARLVTPGVKTGWTDDEIGEVRAPADPPSRLVATWAQAREDCLKMAGLSGPVAPDVPEAVGRDVVAVPGGFTLAMAPAISTGATPGVQDLLSACRAPIADGGRQRRSDGHSSHHARDRSGRDVSGREAPQHPCRGTRGLGRLDRPSVCYQRC
jgi:hypothetical protein